MYIPPDRHPRLPVWIGLCAEAGWSPDEIAEAFDLAADDEAGEVDQDDEFSAVAA